MSMEFDSLINTQQALMSTKSINKNLFLFVDFKFEMSSDQASGSKFPDSGHGSGVKRTADTDSDSEQSQNKRGKKEKSPTLESLIILKRAVYLLLNVCGEIAYVI